MTRPVSTADAAKALRSLIDVHARETADNNFVSSREFPRLHPFLRRIELQLRDEGGPGS